MTKKTFLAENTILTFAYALIDLVKLFSLEKIARAAAAPIAFTYVLGNYAGDYFHKVRHTLEEHLTL